MSERDLLAGISLGIDAQRFLETPLGVELVKRCTENHEAALTELLEADPENAVEIRRLQCDARLPLMLLEYLNDVIGSGLVAEDQIQQEGKE
jgi:hypothetical protein